jgi:integrase
MIQLPLYAEDVCLELEREALRLRTAAFSRRTLDTYKSDWRHYSEWCTGLHRNPLPSSYETVKLYITSQLHRGLKVKTVKRMLGTIAHYHREAAHTLGPLTEIYQILKGTQRLRGEQPVQKAPVSVDQLRQMAVIPSRYPPAHAARDRAVVLFGFASALRRSTLVELEIADVAFTEAGMIVSIRREKQDQEGKGRTLGIPYGRHEETCPVRAVERWLAFRGSEPGPLFPSFFHYRLEIGMRMQGNTVAKIVKRAARAIGLDPARYGAHSLRAGFATESIPRSGEILTARHTGHRSLQTLKLYMRQENPFEANACAQLGL